MFVTQNKQKKHKKPDQPYGPTTDYYGARDLVKLDSTISQRLTACNERNPKSLEDAKKSLEPLEVRSIGAVYQTVC